VASQLAQTPNILHIHPEKAALTEGIRDVDGCENNGRHNDSPLGKQAGREIAESAKANKLDLLLGQHCADDGIAKGPQFDLALDGIAGLKIRINVAWMAAQLSETFPHVALHQAPQAAHA